MAINERLYRDERDYLRRYGKLIAKENPRLEMFLANKEADPKVERLLEGFSLLTARLREKIEDEFPEVTVPIITRLCPGYLRPVPALTIIEYTPDSRMLTTPVMISRGEQVMNRVKDSQPENARPGDEVADGLPPCIFTLCRDIRLLPLRTEAIQNCSSLSAGIMDMTFSITGHARITAADLNGISFWLGSDDECSRHQLYLWLSRYRSSAELIVGMEHYPQPSLALSPAGFSAQESPLPHTDRDGYRIIQDWFCFPDVQAFFTLSGIAFPGEGLTGSFTLRLHFDRPLPGNLHLNRDALRLHCAPAVNLFAHDAVPFTPDTSRRDWPLTPDAEYPEHYAIFSVMRVTGQDDIPRGSDGLPDMTCSRRRNALLPWDSLQHSLEYHRERNVIYWRHLTKSALLRDAPDHFIILQHADGSPPGAGQTGPEPIQVSLICTNGDQPARLAPGDICVAVGQEPSVASFRNVTVPSASLLPVPDGPLHWSLLSAMTLNYLTLNDVEVLRDILRTFDRHGIHEPLTARLSPEKLAALEKLETRPSDRLFQGIMRRGLESVLYVSPQPFCCEGEIYRLGTVLSYFFALYASTNSWHRLTLINTRTREVWQWNERTGQFPAM